MHVGQIPMENYFKSGPYLFETEETVAAQGFIASGYTLMSYAFIIFI